MSLALYFEKYFKLKQKQKIPKMEEYCNTWILQFFTHYVLVGK